MTTDNFLFSFEKQTYIIIPVKQEVNGTVLLPTLVFPVASIQELVIGALLRSTFGFSIIILVFG